MVKWFFWPERGWNRAGRYVWHRLNRLPGTPHSIAAGLACGGALSVTPFVGIHFFLAALLAWLMRGNVLASAFGTAIGNPWTFPIIWVTTYYLGQLILGQGLPSSDMTVDFADMFSGLVRSMIDADGALFMDRVWPVWWPMIVGSIPAALITWLLMYTFFYRFVEAYQKRRIARRALRIKKLKAKLENPKRESAR